MKRRYHEITDRQRDIVIDMLYGEGTTQQEAADRAECSTRSVKRIKAEFIASHGEPKIEKQKPVDNGHAKDFSDRIVPAKPHKLIETDPKMIVAKRGITGVIDKKCKSVLDG